MRSSCGVCGVKWITGQLWPKATETFEPCCKWHDQQYKAVDWSVGTEEIDAALLHCMLIHAGEDKELQKTAYTWHGIARRWGQMRQRLWRIGICW